MNGNERAVPRPVPDLPSAVPDLPSAAPAPAPAVPSSAVSSSGVSDEERNRFGILLDHAAERGLLSPAEYQVRLAELADATSVEQLQRIVTELPVLGGRAAPSVPAVATGAPTGAAGSVGGAGPDLDAALWAGLTPTATRRGRNNPWIVLIIMVAVLLVALVVLALVASHVAHTHTGGASGLGGAGLSYLRL